MGGVRLFDRWMNGKRIGKPLVRGAVCLAYEEGKRATNSLCFAQPVVKWRPFSLRGRQKDGPKLGLLAQAALGYCYSAGTSRG